MWKMMFAVLICATSGTIAGCCYEHSTSTHTPEVADPSCKTPGVTGELHRAICVADQFAVEQTLFSADFQEHGDGRQMLGVIVRLWNADKTYGSGLRWYKLESRDFRTVLAQYIAQGLRNRWIDAPPAKELQRFALGLIDSAPPDDDDQLARDGLKLLGLTNAEDQIGLLRNFALSRNQPLPRRETAIIALGQICTDATPTLLEDVRNSATDDPDRIEIGKRVDIGLEAWHLWCVEAQRLRSGSS
jgi:hypothetical protein